MLKSISILYDSRAEVSLVPKINGKTYIDVYTRQLIIIFPPFRAWSKEYLGLKKKLLDYIEGIVNEHKSTFSENILRDYIGTCSNNARN